MDNLGSNPITGYVEARLQAARESAAQKGEDEPLTLEEYIATHPYKGPTEPPYICYYETGDFLGVC